MDENAVADDVSHSIVVKNPSESRPDTQSMSVRERVFAASVAPVDISSLILFRIGFGLIAAWWAIDYLTSGEVGASYVTPRFHFSYWLFGWVRPWPHAGPYFHFVALAFLAGCIAAGLAYRAVTLLFALGFTIFFLWDRTNYQNHYYLMLLLSWLLVLLPLHRAASLDVINAPAIASGILPTWMLWLVRIQIGIPYVYGGLAKINSEWLAGGGLRDYLVTKGSVPLIRSWLVTNNAAVTLAWAGMLFDLGIVPLLTWRRTRMSAYCLVVAFHLCNHLQFSIHIFPWFMMLATTVFFEPDWSRRLFNHVKPEHQSLWWSTTWKKYRWGTAIVATVIVAELLVPLRHYLYSGDTGWHERGHYFAWRMMLRTKRSALRVYLTDPNTGATWNPDLLESISLRQVEVCARDPEMILDLAHWLRDEYRQRTGRTVEVRCLVLCCYNGRKPQPLIDPTLDLANEPRGWHVRNWVCPQSEPLPTEPWKRPVREWQQSVLLPQLPKITMGPHGERLAASTNSPRQPSPLPAR